MIFAPQGLNILIPIIDEIKYLQSLKEIAIEVPQQSAITRGDYSFTNLCITVIWYVDAVV